MTKTNQTKDEPKGLRPAAGKIEHHNPLMSKAVIMIFFAVVVFGGIFALKYMQDKDNNQEYSQEETIPPEELALQQAVNEANAKVGEKDYDGAVAVWAQFLEESPDSPYKSVAMTNQVTIYINAGDKAKAGEIAKKINPDELDTSTASALANYYELTGDFESAAKYLRVTADKLEEGLPEHLKENPASETSVRHDIEFMREKAKKYEEGQMGVPQ